MSITIEVDETGEELHHLPPVVHGGEPVEGVQPETVAEVVKPEPAFRLLVLRENLATALEKVGHAVIKRSTLPILEHVLLRATAAGLYLTSNDLEKSIEVHCNCRVELEGETCVPFRVLRDLVVAHEDGLLTLWLDEGQTRLMLESDTARLEIITADPQEFPFGAVTANPVGQIKAYLLREMVAATLAAVSADASRPILTGALFRAYEGKVSVMSDEVQSGMTVEMVTADGFRLAHAWVENVGGIGHEFAFVVPGSSFGALQKLLRNGSKEDDVIEMSSGREVVADMFGENIAGGKLCFKIGDNRLTTTLIEGRYPDYRQIIPKDEQPIELTIKAGDLKRSGKLVQVFSPKTWITLDFKDIEGEHGAHRKKIEVGGRGVDLGEGDREVWASHVQSFVGDDYINLNANFLASTMEAMGEDDVVIRVTSPAQPAKFTRQGKSVVQVEWVVMPMHVKR